MASTGRQHWGGGLIPLSKFSEKNFPLSTTELVKEKGLSLQLLLGLPNGPDTSAKRLQKVAAPFGCFPTPVIRSPLICYFPLTHKEQCVTTAEIRQASCSQWLFER